MIIMNHRLKARCFKVILRVAKYLMLFDKPVEVNSFRSFEEEDFNITVDLA